MEYNKEQVTKKNKKR